MKEKKLLIITCVYNRLPLVKQCVEAVIQNTNVFEMYTKGISCTYALVYNHPPYLGIKQYLEDNSGYRGGPDISCCMDVRLLDPGRNLGCHRGFNYALGYYIYRYKPDYIVKLDDDTIVPKNWNIPMMEVLEQDKKLAYLSSVDKDAKQGKEFFIKKIGKYNIEIPKIGCVGFSCVMFPIRSLIEIGTLQTGGLVRMDGDKIEDSNLYGGEEMNYMVRVKEHHQYGAYIQGVVAQHLKNEDRDIDYVLWKYWYGFKGATKKDLVEFKKDKKELIRGYEHMLTIDNKWWRETAIKRLKELKKSLFSRLLRIKKRQ